VLSDAAERAAYDRTLAQRAGGGEPGAGGAGRGRSAARQEPRYAWENIGQPKGEGPGSGRGRKRKGGAAGGEAQGIESGFEEVWRAFYGPREKAEREKRG
jgi:DnaJ-class molecular chaperone